MPFTLTGCKKEEYEYDLHLNISYGEHQRNTLDMCIPNREGTVGLILMIHGGGWIGGDKSVYQNDLVKWCKNYGYVTASINYRYASNDVNIDHIVSDIEMSLYKIKELASNNNINVQNMLLTGGSAGAHLSLYYAYAKADTSPITPKAVVSYCGPTDLTDPNFFINDGNYDACLIMASLISGFTFNGDNYAEAYTYLQHASPVNFVTQNSVPTVICHGLKDDLVPYSNATILKEKLDIFGVKNDLVKYYNSGHDLSKDNASTKQAESLMLKYAKSYL